MSERRSPWQVALAVVLALGVAVAFAYRDRLGGQSIAEWIASFGLAAPLAFIVARVIGAVVLVPGSVMAIAAGAAFGFAPGAAYNLIASTLGAMAAFGLARYVAPNTIRPRIAKRAIVNRLISGIESEGWRFVAFVRLVPLFPYNLVNYAFGLTSIRFMHYSAATFICMIPGDLAYVYTGFAAREAMAGSSGAWRLGLIALAALAALAFLPRLVRRLRGPNA